MRDYAASIASEFANRLPEVFWDPILGKIITTGYVITVPDHQMSMYDTTERSLHRYAVGWHYDLVKNAPIVVQIKKADRAVGKNTHLLARLPWFFSLAAALVGAGPRNADQVYNIATRQYVPLTQECSQCGTLLRDPEFGFDPRMYTLKYTCKTCGWMEYQG